MTDFLIFCMATVGLTAILVDGKIFLSFRERLDRRVREQEERQQKKIASGGMMRRSWSGFLLGIVTCYQCCGFWSGLFCGLFFTVSRCLINTPIVFFIGLQPQTEAAGVVQFVFAAFFWLMCGFVGSFLATAYLMLVELIFAKTMLYRRTNPESTPDDED